MPEQTEEIKCLQEQLRQEIAAREQLEQAWHERENYLADTQRIAKLGCWNWNVRTGEVKWSTELFRLLDYDPAEITPSRQAFLDRVHPDDLAELKQAIETLITRNKPFSIDHRIITADGTTSFMQSQGRLEIIEGQEPVFFFGTLQDITRHKILEQELKVTTNAVASSINAVGIADINGTITYVNDALVTMWGYDSPEEILGRPIFDFLEGDTILETVKELQLSGGKIGEDIGRRKDGSTFPVQFAASMIKDEAGNPVAMFGSFIDITKQKKADKELKENAKFLQGILSSLLDHVCVVDPQGKILMVNEAWLNFARANDIKSLDLISQGTNYLQACELAAVNGDHLAQQAYNGIKSVINEEKPSFQMEYPCHSPSTERWFVMTVTYLYTGKGGAVIVHKDITARKIAEHKTQISEDQLKEAQRIASLGSWEWSFRTDSIVWSDETYRIFGLDPQQVKITKELFLEMIHPDDRQYLESEIENALTSYSQHLAGTTRKADKGFHKQFQIQYRIIRADKSIRYLAEQAEIKLDEAGIPAKAIGTVHDITEKKNAEFESERLKLELAHLNRVGTLDLLASSLAHEINQPLAAILSNAQAAIRFLNSEYPDMVQVQEALDDIVSDDKRASDIIRQLGRLVKKEKPLSRAYYVNETIENVLKLLHSECVINHITLTTELEPGIPALYGDPVNLQQVLMNLCINSIEALANKPEDIRSVKVTSKAENGKGAVIVIEDNGPGIEEKDLPAIFNSFYTTKSQGMGLGLAMCKSMIEAEAGHIKAENIPEGGARFSIRLPYEKNGPEGG